MATLPDNERARIRAWIEAILQRTGWSRNRLAIEAGVSPSTITDIFSDRKHTTSTSTIAKIERATGMPLRAATGGQDRAGGARFAEPEAVYLAADSDADGMASHLPVTGEQAIWRLSSLAIQLIGCLPGDLLLVDPAVSPRAGDVICVQIYDLERGSAETVFRVYEPPYALTRTAVPYFEPKPLLIDQERVVIWGTVIAVTRWREP